MWPVPSGFTWGCFYHTISSHPSFFPFFFFVKPFLLYIYLLANKRIQHRFVLHSRVCDGLVSMTNTCIISTILLKDQIQSVLGLHQGGGILRVQGLTSYWPHFKKSNLHLEVTFELKLRHWFTQSGHLALELNASHFPSDFFFFFFFNSFFFNSFCHNSC